MLPQVASTDDDTLASYLFEFEGHPWDSYKEHSDLTPYLILVLLDILERSGFKLECRANIRGMLDALFFIKQSPPANSTLRTVRIGFSLCHQNTFRIYGGTVNFCNWIRDLLQQLWISGVASEKQVSFVSSDKRESESGSPIDVNFTEVKFHGTPFCIPEWNKDNFLAAQYMIGRFVGILSLIGWRLLASLNVYSSPYDKGVLIFEKDMVSVLFNHK